MSLHCPNQQSLRYHMNGRMKLRSAFRYSRALPQPTKTVSNRRLDIRNTYPEPETEKERSPIDFPQEWITPQPSRRPDIFPEFEKLETPLPKPLPGDPELPDEEEQEEEEKKKRERDPDNPDEENPDQVKPDEPDGE